MQKNIEKLHEEQFNCEKVEDINEIEANVKKRRVKQNYRSGLYILADIVTVLFAVGFVYSLVSIILILTEYPGLWTSLITILLLSGLGEGVTITLLYLLAGARTRLNLLEEKIYNKENK